MKSLENTIESFLEKTPNEQKNLGTFTSVYRDEVVDKYLPQILNKNFVDKKAYSALANFEEIVDEYFKSVFKNNNGETVVTSGSTESILLSLYYAREKAKENGIDKPNVVVSKSTHYSFYKCAKLLDVDVKVAKLTENYDIDLKDVEKQIDKNTVLLVGILGATEHGVIDDVAGLDNLAVKFDIDLHIDAAIGGFLVPYLSDNRKVPYTFDAFKKLVSMNISGHKYGLSLPGCGILLLRDKDYLDKYSENLEYLSSGNSRIDSILVTKSGMGVFSLATNILRFGYNGYKRMAKDYRLAKNKFISQLDELEIPYFSGSEMIPIVFIFPEDVHALSHFLTNQGWIQGVYKAKALGVEGLRIVVKKGQEDLIVDELVEDIKEFYSENENYNFQTNKNLNFKYKYVRR